MRSQRGGFDRSWWSWCGVILVVTAGTGCGTVVLDANVASDGTGTDTASEPGIVEGDDTTGAATSGPTSGGGDDSGGPPAAGCEEYEALATSMLEETCSGCHGPGGGAPGGFSDALDIEGMIAEGRIVPGDAGGSMVYTRVESGTMPPAAAAAQPSAAQVQALAAWIDDCLPQAQCSHDDFIPLDDMLSWMSDDVRQIDAEDRPFVRYLTVTHVYNLGLCGEALDLHRFGLFKAVNSLSTEVELVSPEPIDPEQTVYRIDIRDYGWSRATWDAVVAASPYAVAYDFTQARDLAVDTQTAVPFLIADNFVVDAVQPPLYHALLDLPATRSELEASLGVDVAQDIFDEEVARAGFGDSNVSVNNRVIERHVLPSAGTRVYWLSYDFASNAQQSNIFSNPLGFEAAGNEVIFSLPNGLHAYLIVDGDGNRLDEAPDDIVTDPSSPNGNVRNGLSCMNCHQHGIIEHEDALREHVLDPTHGFSQDVRDTVAAIYPENPDLMELKAIDRDNYADALTLIGVPQTLPTDPVNAVFRDFDADLDLGRAAAELGIPVEVLQAQLGGLPEDLQPLATGTIKREVFTVNYAQAVCDLNLGFTAACSSLGDTGEGVGCEDIDERCFDAACLIDPASCGCADCF